jgi:Undecaprenyl-phosphate glucose phosphotransferase
MIRRRRHQLLRLFIVSDIGAIVSAFLATFWLRFHSGLLPAPKGIPAFGHYLVALPMLMIVQLIYFSSQEFYTIRLRRNRLDDLFMIITNSAVSSFLILMIVSYLKSYRFVNFEISHHFLLVYIPIASSLVFAFRAAVFRSFRHHFLNGGGASRVIIAGHGELAEMTAANLRRYRHFGIEICGFLHPGSGPDRLGDYADLERLVRAHGVTDLFIALPLREYDTIMQLIDSGNNLMIDIRLVPDLLQLASLKAGMEHIEGLPIINLGDIPLQGWHNVLKRAFDLVFGCLSLLLALPFCIVIAAAIKLTSRGPVFYRQARVGLDGRIFHMLKFRTMVANAESRTGPIWAQPQDSRVTPLGRFLRKYSIDETPQLLNVIKGDMSLVGPRPERPEFVEQFKTHIPRYMLRHRVKTGMTGWAQVHGLRGNTPLDKRIEFDIYYIQNWTFRLDLEIVWRTLLKFQFIDRNS